MDSGVMDLSDRVVALEAEIRRLRAAAGHVVNKSTCSNPDEQAELEKAIRKMHLELERFAPSMASKGRRL